MRAALTSAVAVAALLLGGCGLLGLGRVSTTSLEKVRIIAFPAANGRMATAIDVVFVYQPEAVAQLPKGAPEWFAKRAELLGAAPGAMEVAGCQLPPGETLEELPLPPRHAKAVRVIAYTNHQESDGQHAVNLTPLRKAVLWLNARTVGAMEEGQPMVPSEDE